MAKKQDTPAPKAAPKTKLDVSRAIGLLRANLDAAHPSTNGTVIERTLEAIAVLGG